MLSQINRNGKILAERDLRTLRKSEVRVERNHLRDGSAAPLIDCSDARQRVPESAGCCVPQDRAALPTRLTREHHA